MSSRRFDLLIRQARIIDGTGAPAYRGDLGIRGEKIEAVSSGQLDGEARDTLDARGMILCPGFIDVHSHDDFAVLMDPEMGFKTMQGVTTDVVGNCGFGPAPYEVSRGFGKSLYADRPLPTWTDHAAYFDLLRQEPPSLNVAMLVGHGTLRASVMGNEKRAPTSEEMKQLRDLLVEGLEAGAVGFSSGLIYEPGRFAKTGELVLLAQAMSDVGGLYATHMRDEGLGLVRSVEEAIQIGAEGGVPVQISHHKASGKAAWGAVKDSLRRIDAARARGVQVFADQYPYTAGSTVLSAVHAWLSRADERERLEPEDVVVASAPHDPELEGRSLATIGRLWDVDPVEASERILKDGGGTVWVVMHMMCEDDVETVLRHPSTMIGSDGIPTDAGKPHPRLFGTFARVLGHYVREQKVLPLETAIYRMTGLPAERFGLADRGTLIPGSAADLVLFDHKKIADRSTFESPRRHPAGITHVWVNGTKVVSDGTHTTARPGLPLAPKRG